MHSGIEFFSPTSSKLYTFITKTCATILCRNTQLYMWQDMAIDGFQIKRPTFGGQTRDQEAAVQQTFHLERSSFFYLSVLMVRLNVALTGLNFAHNCTEHRPQLLPSRSEAMPHENHLYVKQTCLANKLNLCSCFNLQWWYFAQLNTY